jgi:molecular chaperone HtpG
MSNEKGNLSINSENIFPIIKKWLYSDTDIFVRELVSNASDAITKVKKLTTLGEYTKQSENEKLCIQVRVDSAKKTIEIEDNGIGMTADEIKEYINQIAFSGATDFMEKYKDKIEQNNEIIGHFGLGFYSSFMVADTVEINTLSYKENSEPARWVCDGGIEYEMTNSDKETVGTIVTLHVNEENLDFLDEYKVKSILKKYCEFIPVEIYYEFVKEITETENSSENEDEVLDVQTPINNPNPLWTKNPNEVTEEEYKSFYREVFNDYNEPLFWIHLNMDYPFNLKGILYFPKLKHELESIEGQVKLYNNQVFIADNIKEVIPEFLLLLKGTIDCPDLPLNVSRSFLQNDGYVTKMSNYITKKVADKLNSVFKKDRESYNGYWDDISPFIKYGCIKDKNFYDKVKPSLLFKTINDEFLTLEEFKEKNKEKTENKVFYVTNEQQQSQYIKTFRDEEMEAVILTTNLDNAFISYLENYETSVKFSRIDSDISSVLKKEGDNDDKSEELQALFRDVIDNKELLVKSELLKSDTISGLILLSEESRRMQEMSKMFGGGVGMMPDMFKNEETLVLNGNNSLVKTLINIKDDEAKKDSVNLICKQIYDLALMSHKPLSSEAMTEFIERSNKILELIVNQ